MTHEIHDAILRTGTSTFIRRFCDTLKDMANVLYAPVPETPASQIQPENSLTVIAQFFGTIQGEFLISTSESTAAGIAGKYTPGAATAAITVHRDSYSGLLCEALNISAHQALPELEKKFGRFTLLPPAWVYGEYHTVDYISGIGLIKGIHGAIRCSLVLNMAYTHVPSRPAAMKQ